MPDKPRTNWVDAAFVAFMLSATIACILIVILAIYHLATGN